MKYTISLIFFTWVMLSCKKGPVKLDVHFENSTVPKEVDYTKSDAWAALPTKKDMADSLPNYKGLIEGQNIAKTDVFFIHPTIFTYQPTDNYQWNASVYDTNLNTKVDNSTILNQASVFNGTCKVYAPRYRQAHYHAFVTENKEDAKQALDLAYEDVKKAFQYYLQNYNQERPIIIAAHSQGTVHAVRLMKEFFDGKPLQKQLVMAYLVGIAVPATSFVNIKQTESTSQTGCFASWNTFSKGYLPPWYSKGLNNAVCTNPISWNSEKNYEHYSRNKGGIGLGFKFYPELCDAQVHNGVLWIGKPNIKGAFFVRRKNWHAADINFYWMNIRENVSERIQSYLQKQKDESR